MAARLQTGVPMRIGVLAVAWLMAAPAGATDAFRVIVNAKVPGQAVPKQTLAHIFLGRVKRWGDGRPIAAVDLPSTSPVRAAFTKDVLDMTTLAVRTYWMQLLQTGERPPLTRPSDQAVIAFVAGQGGAIGYVSSSAALPDTVRAVAVE